ncbi:MAG: GNAT family N-acetyltransferase [Firmicutes bacterium]|nr:GNAT family N-acetyltransferase [Bacillota bacterium]
MEFRRADKNDIPMLAEIRKKQLLDEGQKPYADMGRNLIDYFTEKMESGELIEWVGEEGGQIVAAGAIVFMDFPPAFTNPTGKKGYIANMYTADEYRGRGIAGKILDLLEQEARARGLTKLVLFASQAGRKAYVKNGFREDDILMEKSLTYDDFTIRLEEEKDHREVENLVREAFWNVYRPGCSEHYVIHVLRDDPAFVKELDFVMEQDGRIIGQNMFMRTVIEADDGRVIPVLTMGPICISPELKSRGYGKALLDYSLDKAAGMGFGAVLFEGSIEFYGRSGFGYASEFGIRYHDIPEDADQSFFLCKELIPGYLDGITGVYQTPQGYYVKDEEVEEFDKGFPPKVKLKLPGQIF